MQHAVFTGAIAGCETAWTGSCSQNAQLLNFSPSESGTSWHASPGSASAGFIEISFGSGRVLAGQPVCRFLALSALRAVCGPCDNVACSAAGSQLVNCACYAVFWPLTISCSLAVLRSGRSRNCRWSPLGRCQAQDCRLSRPLLVRWWCQVPHLLENCLVRTARCVALLGLSARVPAQ